MSTTPLISLLIPTVAGRENYVKRIENLLREQIQNLQAESIVELCINHDESIKKIGTKRNELMDVSKGTYTAFIDDDDTVTDYHVSRMITAAHSGKDCASLLGHYYLDGKFERVFEHSIKYDSWGDNGEVLFRCPNHLNLVKKELVYDIKFNEINFGEDGMWSMQINNEKRLKTEFYIPDLLYNYLHRSTK